VGVADPVFDKDLVRDSVGDRVWVMLVVSDGV